MNPSRPTATHVAVRDGRILGVGDLEDLAGWGPYRLDEVFADKVLLPGFVEGHTHLMAGGAWRYVYCGVFDARDPDGDLVKGSPSFDAVVEALGVGSVQVNDQLDEDDAITVILGSDFVP